MAAEVAVCSYRFTMEQFRAAMRGYWKQSHMAWIAAAVTLVLGGISLSTFFNSTDGLNANLFGNLAPLLIYAALMAYLFLFAPYRAFKKNTAYNQELIYTLGAEGYSLKTPLAHAQIAWAAVPRWKENSEGFRIYTEGLRSFHWLPKSGFATTEAVANARRYLGENIVEKKKAGFSWTYGLLVAIAVLAVAGYYMFLKISETKIRAWNDKASGLVTQGRYAEALLARKKAWDDCRTNLAKSDPLYSWTEGQLARDYELMGQSDQAGPLYEEALKLEQTNLPADYPDTIINLNCYSIYCYDQGDYDKAADLADDAYHLAHQRYGPDHAETLAGMNNLALADEQLDRKREAEDLWNEVLRIKRQVYGVRSDELAITMNNLAHLYAGRGNLESARDFYQQAYELHKRNLGDHPDTAYEEYNLASILKEEGKLAEARPLLENSLRIREKMLGKDHPDTVDTRALLQSVEK